MTTRVLKSAEDYFVQIVMPNHKNFFENESTFVSVINLATCLFHFHEWLFDSHKAELNNIYNESFTGKGAFWKAVEQIDNKFGYIRDVTNASKHVHIGEKGRPQTSTGMTHIADTQIITSGWGENAWGQGKYGGAPSVIFDDGGQAISFDACAAALFKHWKYTIEKINNNICI